MLKLRLPYALMLAFVFTFQNEASAQLENKIFHQKDSFYSDTHTVRLHAELFNYLRNTEYFDLIEKGQTFFGSIFQMHLSYQPYKNVLFKGGIQARQDYGHSGFISVQPIFGISVKHKKWLYNLGMLQGNSNYGFIEPMYNIDKSITNRVENGLQSIYRSDQFYFNNFLVWNEATYRTTTNQERFTTGIVAERNIIKRSAFQIGLPMQATLAHRGGQLNSNPEPIYTRINFSAGLKLKCNLSENFTIRTEHYWLHSQDFSPRITQPYKDGNASWHTLAFASKGFELMFHYWAGREYQSPVGTLIYNNYNTFDVYEHRRVRHMIMSRIMYTKALYSNLFADFRFEPFYDQEYGRFQYSYSIYLKLNLNTRLGKVNFY